MENCQKNITDISQVNMQGRKSQKKTKALGNSNATQPSGKVSIQCSLPGKSDEIQPKNEASTQPLGETSKLCPQLT